MAFGFGGILGGGPVPDVQMPDGLPVSGGKGSPLVDAYLALQAKRIQDAVTAPRDSITGDLPIFGPDGHPTAEAMDRASGMAGIAMTGSMPFSAPTGSLRVFGGRNAATADQHALKEAEWLHNAGGDREHIWDATGWFKAPDGNWKFEIPDELSTIGTPKNAPAGYGQLHHDDLAQAYPSMWQNTGQSIREAPVASGRFDAHGDVIHAQGPTDAAQRSVALHEMQHAIQRKEGFARGDNPANFGPAAWEAAGRPMLSEASDAAAAQSAWARDQYHRSAGEVEARNVQARADMTPEQRFSTPPWLTQDVPDAQQIVRLYSGGPSGAAAGLPALASSSDPKGPPVSAGLDTAAPSMLDGLSPELIARLLQSQQPQQPSPVDSLLFDRASMGAPGNGFSGRSGTLVEPPQAQASPEPRVTGALPQPAPVPGAPAAAPPAAPAMPEPAAPTAGAPAASVQPVNSFDPLSGQPVSGSPKPVGAPSAPKAEGGFDFGGALSRMNQSGLADQLIAIGAGILSGRNFGEGLGQGLSNAQRAATAAAAGQLQQLKLQREQAALTGNAQILKRAYPNLSDSELAAMATESGNVTTALQILRDPTHGMPKTPEQIQAEARASAAGSMEGGAKPLDRIKGEAQAAAEGATAGKPDDPKLVDVPQGDGTTIKTWVKPGEATGQAVGAPEASSTANEAAKQAQRRQGVVSAGKDPNDPRYSDYILSGSLPKETQQLLTASDKKAIMEGEDTILGHKNTITQLNRAMELSKKAYDGAGAGARAMVVSNVPSMLGGHTPESLATREYANVVTGQALDNLKATFGGAPTEGERAILLQVQGSADMPQALREQILQNAIAKAQQKLDFEQQRVDQLRGGTYYKQQGGGQSGGGSAPAGAVTGAKRLRFDPSTGGFN